MRYKIMGVLLCTCAIVLSLVAPSLENHQDVRRVHQHLEVAEKAPDQEKNQGFSTHLPLVMLKTDGKQIPGRAIVGKNGHSYYTTAADGATSIRATMDIVDHQSTYNHAKDTPTLQSEIMIQVRGRSSRYYEKSNYDVRLVDQDGKNNPQPVMGMDAHHEWVLHGPYLDKTLMRNYMWYNIAGEIMGYAPNVRFCEVLLNGKYQGVYVMIEKLTAGKDGARLNLTVDAKDNTFSGYLLQYNSGHKTNHPVINNFTAYTGLSFGPFEVMYPGSRNLTDEMVDTIGKEVSDFEKALYSFDYDSEKYGYKSHIDVDSFIDYYLINEVTCNLDAGSYSTYIGKDVDGKYKMYLWDMNSCCDNYQEAPVDRWDFFMQDAIWFNMLMRDEDFTEAVIDRYWELRETVFDPDYLCDYMDDVVAYLGPAVARNNNRWYSIYQITPETDLLHPLDRNPKTYDAACNQMKNFLRMRIAWLDNNIETIRQYSAESRVKKYSEVPN